MIAKTRAVPKAKLVLVVALLSCAALLAPASSMAAKTAGKAAVLLPTESLQTYEHQLESGQVAAAVFNIKGRDIHLTLTNGTHVIVHYPPHQEEKLLEALKAKGIVPVNGKGAAVKPPKAHKHKIRYIAGGVVIILIIIVVAILMIRRKRASADDY